MNPLYVYFSADCAPSPVDIQSTIEGLLQYYLSKGEPKPDTPVDASALAGKISANLNDSHPPIVDPANLPTPEESWQKRIDTYIACALEMINQITSSTVEVNASDFSYSYLNKNWKQFEKGTGVITKNNSAGTTFFLFPNTLITDDGQVNRKLPVFPFTEENTPRMASEKMSVLSKSLAQPPFDSLVL